MPLFPLFHPTKKQQTQHLERAMTGPTPGAAPVSHSYPPRHHQRHQRRPRAAAAGPASLLALLACCSTALGFVVPPRAPMSRIHVLPGGGPHGASSSSSSTATMMMTAADELPQDQNLPTLPSSSSPPRSTLPAVLGGLSLPFLARTGQAALAAPGAGRIAGRATDIPPPPPPSNSRIERSYTPSRSSSSSFEFSRSIPKIRIQDGDLMSNDRVVLHGRPVQKTDVAVFGGFVGVALAQAEFAKRRERGGGAGGVEGDVFLVTYQVALYDRDQHGLMRALQRLAQRAETTTSSGLASLASSVSLELLRSYEGWVAATAQSGRFKDMAAAERAFNEASMKERKKWGFENSVEDRAAAALAARQQQQRGGGRGKENELAAAMAGKQLIVLTLMVACRNIGGKNILPKKQGSAEALENSLERFAAALLEKNGKNVLAVDVSWTPDGEGETLSRKDVMLKWPELLDL